MSTVSTRPAARWLSSYAFLLVGAVILLLVAGALVTSTGSGLAVPDWPLSYGQLMPPMEGGVLFEHGHRMIATLVGALTVLFAVWIHRVDRRAWVKRLGWIAVGLVILQGILGGVTVLLGLPLWTSAAHACLAQGFLMVIVSLALALSPGWTTPGAVLPAGNRLPAWALLSTGLIYLQLILGALTRHLHAALVFPDFPLVGGALVPDAWTPGIAVHYAHRVGALIVGSAAVITGMTALRLSGDYGSLRRSGAALIALVSVQILLGGSIVWTGRHVGVATAHVVVGALLLVVSLVLTVGSRRRSAAGAPAKSALGDTSPAVPRGATA